MTNKEFNKMYPKANLSDFAREITLKESLEQSLSIAQVKEVIHYVGVELVKYRQWRKAFGRYTGLEITKPHPKPKRRAKKGKRK